MPQRIAYTVAGLVIVVVCLLPFDWLDTLAGTDLQMNFSVWIVVRDPDRARRLVGDRLQRGPPARRRDGSRRSHPRADADPPPVDRVSAAEPLPHRRDAGDVHARRLHARRGRDDLRLVRPRVRRRGDVRRRVRRPRRAPRRSARSTTPRGRSRTRRAFGLRTSASSPRSRTCRCRHVRPGTYASTFENYPVRGVDAAFSTAHDVPPRRARPRVTTTRGGRSRTSPGSRSSTASSPRAGTTGAPVPGTARLPAQGLLPRGPWSSTRSRSWFATRRPARQSG